MQDPHHVQARPSLIARARSADLMVCTGARARDRLGAAVASGRPATRRSSPASPAIFEGGEHVAAARAAVERRSLAGRRAPVRQSAHADSIRATSRRSRPRSRNGWRSSTARTPRPTSALCRISRSAGGGGRGGREQVAPLKGMQVVTHHKGWAYLENWLGLAKSATSSRSPGLPPSAAHLAELLEQLRAGRLRGSCARRTRTRSARSGSASRDEDSDGRAAVHGRQRSGHAKDLFRCSTCS